MAENSDWVRIANTSDEEVSIAQWKIKLIAGDKEVGLKIWNAKKYLGYFEKVGLNIIENSGHKDVCVQNIPNEDFPVLYSKRFLSLLFLPSLYSVSTIF